MKKQIVLIVLLVTIAFKAKAQEHDFIEYRQNWDKQFMYWGYYLGVNVNDFVIKSANERGQYIETNPSMGFNLGLIGDLRLHKNINLRLEPGLINNVKKIYYTNIPNKQDSVRRINSTYLHIPLLVKFSTDRYYNIRPYVIGGVSYDYNFSSRESDSKDNKDGVFRMKQHNFTYEIGFGIDIYLPYFIFSPSIRGIFAINNEMVRDKDENSKWTTPIHSLESRGIFLKLAFH